MAIWIIHGDCEGSTRAALVDSVSETAFGPLLDSWSEANDFLGFMSNHDVDARLVPAHELEVYLEEFRRDQDAGEASA